jgi:hypothetical protein
MASTKLTGSLLVLRAGDDDKTNRFTKSRTTWATLCQLPSMVSESPRFGLFLISVTALTPAAGRLLDVELRFAGRVQVDVGHLHQSSSPIALRLALIWSSVISSLSWRRSGGVPAKTGHRLES